MSRCFGLKLSNIGKAGIGYLIGNVLLRGISFFSIPLFTFLMSPDEYGKYIVYMSYEAFLVVIIKLGLSGTLRNAKVEFKENFEEYFYNILIVMSVLLSIVLIIVETLRLFALVDYKFSNIIMFVLVVHAYCDSVFDAYLTKLSTAYDYKRYIILSFIITITGIMLSLIFIKFCFIDSISSNRILGCALPYFVITIIIIITTLKGNVGGPNHYIIKYALRLAIPLCVHALSLTVLSNLDRIMISEMIDDNDAGVYSLMSSFANMLSLIWYSVNTAWNQWVYDQLTAKHDNKVKKVSKVYVSVALVVFGIVSLVLPEIVVLMTDDRYHIGISILPALCVGAFFSMPYSLYVLLENYYKQTKYVAIGTVLAGVINILLNYIFISRYGYEAAAYTTMGSYFFLYFFHFCMVRLIMKKRIYDNGYIFTMTVSALPIMLLCIKLSGFMLIRWGIAIAIMIATMFGLYLVNKRVIND